MKKLPQIPEAQQTPLVKVLLTLLEQFAQRILLLEEQVLQLKDEINVLKGQKKRPQFQASNMDKSTEDEHPDDAPSPEEGKNDDGSDDNDAHSDDDNSDTDDQRAQAKSKKKRKSAPAQPNAPKMPHCPSMKINR